MQTKFFLYTCQQFKEVAYSLLIGAMSKCKGVRTSEGIQEKSILDNVALKGLTRQSTSTQSLYKWVCKSCLSQVFILRPEFFCKAHFAPPNQAICQKSCSRCA